MPEDKINESCRSRQITKVDEKTISSKWCTVSDRRDPSEKILCRLNSRFTSYRDHHQAQESRHQETYGQNLQKQREETRQLHQIAISSGTGSKKTSAKSSSGGIGSRSSTKRSHPSSHNNINCTSISAINTTRSNLTNNASTNGLGNVCSINRFDVPEKKPKASNTSISANLSGLKTSSPTSHNHHANSSSATSSSSTILANGDTSSEIIQPLSVTSPQQSSSLTDYDINGVGLQANQNSNSLITPIVKQEPNDIYLDLFEFKDYPDSVEDFAGPDVDPEFVHKYLDQFDNVSSFDTEPEPIKNNLNLHVMPQQSIQTAQPSVQQYLQLPPQQHFAQQPPPQIMQQRPFSQQIPPQQTLLRPLPPLHQQRFPQQTLPQQNLMRQQPPAQDVLQQHLIPQQQQQNLVQQQTYNKGPNTGDDIMHNQQHQYQLHRIQQNHHKAPAMYSNSFQNHPNHHSHQGNQNYMNANVFSNNSNGARVHDGTNVISIEQLQDGSYSNANCWTNQRNYDRWYLSERI